MAISGVFGSLFRSGAEKDSNAELIYASLNQALGTAYTANSLSNIDFSTIAGIENLSIAKAINSIWESNRRLSLQSDPYRMSPIFLPRWEKILGLNHTLTQTEKQRRDKIAALFGIWTKPPNTQNVSDFLKLLIPDIFIKVIHNRSSQNEGSVPGGATVPGGVTLPEIQDQHGNALWFSSISTLEIQVWQPRPHNSGIPIMTDADFYRQLNSAFTFLDNYLPASVTFNFFRYYDDIFRTAEFAQSPGVISVAIGSTAVTGIGTTFLTTFLPGDIFESVDNDGNVQEYEVLSVTNNTHLTLLEPAPSTNTLSTYRVLGFILDCEHNLDNMSFGRE